MRSYVAAFTLLGWAVASPADVLDAKRGNPELETYCITYESTYLVPISMGANSTDAALPATEESFIVSSGSESIPLFSSTQEEVVTTTATLETTAAATFDPEQPTLPTESTTAPSTVGPTGQRIILLITPAGELTKRDVGGFVGNGNPDVCTFATDFTLGQDRLFDGEFPIAYSGEDFQPLQASSSPAANAVTTTFSSVEGVLEFSNPLLPGGRASFCQTPSDGQVYITYSSKPSGCIFVRLAVYGAERCINGKLDGLDASTTGVNQSENAQTTDSSIDETDRPETTDNSIPDISSTGPPNASETNLSSESEVNLPDSTETFPIASTSNTGGGIVFPTMPVAPTRSWSNQTSKVPITSQTSEVAISESAFSSIIPEDASSTIGESSSATDMLESSTRLSTTAQSTTDEPTSTTAETTTTTTEDASVITNRVQNGNFAITAANNEGGTYGFEALGDVRQLSENGYQDDGSSDTNCVALDSDNRVQSRRRIAEVSSSISQYLTGLTAKDTYTISFWYLIRATNSDGLCSLRGQAGYTEFFKTAIPDNDFLNGAWLRALGDVNADVEEAPITIDLDCADGGRAVVLVDSIFATNEATRENIDKFKLDYGNEPGTGN